MRTTIKLLFLIFIFGCKNQPNNKIASLPEIKTEKSEKQATESIFDLIINKKETAENLRKEFNYDSIISLTKEDKLKYRKIGLIDGYYLTNYNFLQKPINSIDFEIYYKISFGDQLEKKVKVKRKDTIFELTLSQTGSDGQQGWYLNTEFLNDSIFIQTDVFKETAKDGNHSMAYAIDSTITTYNYNKWLHYREIKIDSFNLYKEYPTYHKNLKGKIFKTQSNIFEVNNIRCQWEYEVKYTDDTNENSKELMVNLISQRLMKFSPREYILDLDLSKFEYYKPFNIAHLEYNNYEVQDFDINFDGYTDIQFYDRVQGGANHTYFVYLYNPISEKFEFSKELTGGSMENGIGLDKKKKMAVYSGKGGGGLYFFQKIYFRNGKISFSETFRNEITQEYIEKNGTSLNKRIFYYKKYIDKKLVKQKQDTVWSDGMDFGFSQFFKWVDYD